MKKILTNPFLNLTVSVLCLFFLVQKIEWVPIWEELKSIPIGYFITALGLVFALIVPHALRWRSVTEVLGRVLGWSEAIRLLCLSYLFNQVLPTSFGGDVIRAGCLKTDNFTWRGAISSVLIDRAFALLALGLLYVLFYPLLKPYLPEMPFQWIWIGLIGVLSGFIIFLLFAKPILKIVKIGLLEDFFQVLQKRSILAFGLGYSLLIHLGISLAFYILAQGLEIPLSLLTCITLFPLINLATLIPLSFAGWGVREGVIVYMLQFFDVPLQSAFSLSVLYGIIITLTALPGFYVWGAQTRNLVKEGVVLQ